MKDTVDENAKNEMKEATKRDETPPSAYSLVMMPRLSRYLPENFSKQAHIFTPTTMDSTTTKCQVCNDTIPSNIFNKTKVLQCQECGFLVAEGGHPKQHDDCHARAMLETCSKKLQDNSKETDGQEEGVIKQSTDSSANDENETNEDRNENSGLAFVKQFSGITRTTRRKTKYEQPHKFKVHSYGAPTYCAVCQGLLAGLWSQGLQCEVCHLNIHKGEGLEGHDDCRMEALLWPCAGEPVEEENVITLREAMALSPNFFREVTEQMGKDLHSAAKEVVVGAGVEEERSKKLYRLRAKIVEYLELLDAMEERGELYCMYILLRLHLLLAFAVMLTGFLIFRLALCFKSGGLVLGNSTINYLTFMNELTVFGTMRVFYTVLALVLRFYARLFLQKSIMIDRFLRDVFGIDAEQDLGISVAGAARRTRSWCDRLVLATGVTCGAAVIMWLLFQPSLKDHEAMFEL